MTEIDWINPRKIYTVVCRPALPKDTNDVIDLTRTIWGGHDYVPHVWEAWLEDTLGLLAVAEYGGKTIGLGKLTKLAEKEWWLEGLRVHPEYQGKHIASRLMEYLHEYWERTAGGTVRLATPSYRLSIHHLCDRYGFHKIGEFSEFSAPAIGDSISIEEIGFSPVEPGQETEAVHFVNESQSMSLCYELMDLGYQWVMPASSHMVEAIEHGNAWWWRKEKGLLITMDWQEEEQQIVPRISPVACQLGDLPAILEDTRRLAGTRGYSQTGWVAPLHSELQPILHVCSFQRDWDEAVFIYQKISAS